MSPGGMASAMIFVSLLALTVLVGLYTFIYASYSFLVTVQETAAGVDAVRWPRDPIYDKLPRAAYLAALLAICIAPAGLLLRLNPDLALDGSPLLTFLAAAGLLLWGLFPISLLSALSASSPWIVFRLTVLGFFLRHFGATVAFYIVSALLGAGSFGLLYLAFACGTILLTFLVPFVVAAAFLIYARLLGRMSYLFDQMPLKGRRRSIPKTAAQDPWAGPDQPRKTRRSTKKGRRIENPWSVPEEESRPKKPKGKAERMKGYAIAPDDPSISKEKQSSPTRKVKGYQLADEPLPARPTELPHDGYIPVGYEAAPRTDNPTATPESSGDAPRTMSSDFEERYREKPKDEEPPPARPLIDGVYTFPWYPDSIPVWAILSLGGIAGCGLVQAMIVWMP